MRKKMLFVITQFYKGGAETSLLNLFRLLDPEQYDVDFVILNQVEFQDVTSLVEQIPEWIHVYNVIKDGAKGQLADQIIKKIYRRILHTETYGALAAHAVRGKQYDAAFSFGEWLSPAFVANKVNAKKKYVWIHIDIDKAGFVNTEELLKYDSKISKYIFASRKSMEGAIRKCPQIEEKATVIHNFLNVDDIVEKAEVPIDEKYMETPFILSVGNLREEKNYPRQVEVMRFLKELGVSIKWLCVGSTVNERVYNEVQEKIKEYHLEKDFILCGADDNPYRYIKRAQAVMVLSDHESWSLVISEAKLLGIPVIATRTSGAEEQISDGETGLIVDFDASLIAEKVKWFLIDKNFQKKVRTRLKSAGTITSGLKEFEQLMSELV